MIVPIIASTTRDLFSQVPPLPKEGASALGMTDWEVANRVTLPWVRSGIIGATVLGLGRPGRDHRRRHDRRRHPADPRTIYQPLTTSRHDPDPARRRTDRRHRLLRGDAGRAGPGPRRDLGSRQPGRPRHREPDRTGERPHRGILIARCWPPPQPTRRRRVTTQSWRGSDLPRALLIMAPAAWLLLGVVTRAWSHWRGASFGPAHPDRWRTAGPDPRHPDPHGGRLRGRRDGGVMAGIHLSEFTQKGKLSGWLGAATDRLGRPLGVPLDRAGLRRLHGLCRRPGWKLSLLPAVIILSIMVSPTSPRRRRTRCARCPPATARVPRPSACPAATRSAGWC